MGGQDHRGSNDLEAVNCVVAFFYKCCGCMIMDSELLARSVSSSELANAIHGPSCATERDMQLIRVVPNKIRESCSFCWTCRTQ